MNPLQIRESSIIYILCPAGGVTGGPEALHQLCNEINSNGGKSKLVYLDYDSEIIVKSRIPRRYAHYNVKCTTTIEDSQDNVIVVPEIWPHLLNYYSKIQKCIWWLSVNYNRLKNEDVALTDKRVLHLYQSQYAYEFIVNLGISNHAPLFDYLSIQTNPRVRKKNKPIILYNPKKGLEYTQRILEHCKNDNLQFIPLEGFTRSEMIKILKKSFLYIDFGDHPGKDRIPREAAVFNNIIITGTNGSSGNFVDLPISKKFKFEEFNLFEIRQVILQSFYEYTDVNKEFDYYRKVIQTQEMEFTLQTVRLFCEKYNPQKKGIVFNLHKYLNDKIELNKNRVKRVMPSIIKNLVRKHG
jgi:hypothetical protein